MRNLALVRAFLGVVVAAPTAVLAHPGIGDAHDLFHGFVHPMGGLDHMLAMVAVGFIAAQFGGRALWALPGAFLVAMALGGAIGMAGLAMPSPEFFIAFSVVALGAFIAGGIRLPGAVLGCAVAAFGVFHGCSHGLEVGDAHSGVAFGLGFLAASGLLHLAGMGLGLMLERAGASQSQRFVQAGGSVMALAGVVLLAGSLT